MPEAARFPWTAEQIGTLKRLWANGHSASEIVSNLGGGVTRNAVIGKVHRLKLSARRPSVPTTSNQQRDSARAQRGHGNKGQPKVNAILAKAAALKAKPLPLAKPADVSAGIKLTDLDKGQCHWIDGDPLTPEHSYCGEPVREGSSWCDHHHKRVYPGDRP